MKNADWFVLKDTNNVISPSLLVYPKRVKYNAELMIEISEGPHRLRPHIKTHKMGEIIQIQQDLGIHKFKCATLQEAKLLAKQGVIDVLLALQPVATQLLLFVDLIIKYPGTKFSTLIDNAQSLDEFRQAGIEKGLVFDLWLDVNNGMNRTGIKPGMEAEALYKLINNDPTCNLLGLHVYDGHIHNSDLEERTSHCNNCFSPVLDLKFRLESQGFKVETIVAGGTPTFPIHKKRSHVELSPGTPLLWDEGYGSNYKDLKFLPAAVLLTRIISKPEKGLLCFDLGHKSVASEMKLPRVRFLGNHNFEQISQSEEHLVVRTENSESYRIGDVCYAIPIHICPTVSKYPEVLIVENNKIAGAWKVAARDH